MNTYTILKGLLKVAPKKDVRFAMNSVAITPTRLIATDGHQIMAVDNTIYGVDETVIVCRADLESKLKLFTKKEPPELTVRDGVPYLNEYKLVTIAGRYPDVNRVINTAKENKAQTGEMGLSLGLLANLSQAIAIAADDKMSPSLFMIKDTTTPLIIERKGIFAMLAHCRS